MARSTVQVGKLVLPSDLGNEKHKHNTNEEAVANLQSHTYWEGPLYIWRGMLVVPANILNNNLFRQN